jgi:hypothetical protein
MKTHHELLTVNAENWNKLLKFGGVAAIIIVLLIPLQITIFAVFPPPADPLGFYELFHQHWLLGLLSLDLLYIINNIIIIFVYLGLFAALRKTNFALMLIALVVGLIGIAAYFASTVAFEMLSLSNQYFQASTFELKEQLLAAGQAMLVRYKGTSFDVYYVMNAVTLLIVSRVMFQDKTFSRSTAIWGLISGILMIIPSTAGTIGLIFSLLSLIPWIVFSIMIAKRLFNLSTYN